MMLVARALPSTKDRRLTTVSISHSVPVSDTHFVGFLRSFHGFNYRTRSRHAAADWGIHGNMNERYSNAISPLAAGDRLFLRTFHNTTEKSVN